MATITYKEAARLLGIVEGSLHHAIGRGVLTRLPRNGLQQRLIEDQVKLFQGKRLSLNALSNAEKEAWNIYRLEALSDEGDEVAQMELQKKLRQYAIEMIEVAELLTGRTSNFLHPVAHQ